MAARIVRVRAVGRAHILGASLGRVILHLGPVPSESARMWIPYARTVLARSVGGEGPPIPEDVVLAFEEHLNTWEEAAQGTTLVWSGRIDPRVLQSLALAFRDIADDLAAQAEQRGYPISPPEGELFYQALVKAVVEALEHEDGAAKGLSDRLRSDWPGLKET